MFSQELEEKERDFHEQFVETHETPKNGETGTELLELDFFFG